jgi:hypothetical protein
MIMGALFHCLDALFMSCYVSTYEHWRTNEQ